MSIFKGDSIYKSGGGSGGGYKDGGALVDADFIEVTNNTISTYDNTTRNPVNFYFEVADGEIVNSVIEMTTAVNATVNVYVVKNGLYYLLGNVGGNTVTAGNDYKINITGDSYDISAVSSTPIPEYVNIFGKTYPITNINGVFWLAENLDLEFCNIGGGSTVNTPNAWYYGNDKNANGWDGKKCGLLYNFYAVAYLEAHKSELIPGWHVATFAEWSSLSSFVNNQIPKIKALDGSHGGFPTAWNGTNDYKFNSMPTGMFGYGGNQFKYFGEEAYYWNYSTDYSTTAHFSNVRQNDVTMNFGTNILAVAYSVRLVKDA